MKYPGINPDFYAYPVVVFGCYRFAKVPFSDWMPPDFEDVHVHMGGEKYELYWYSPSSGKMVCSDCPGKSLPSGALPDHWLKKLN